MNQARAIRERLICLLKIALFRRQHGWNSRWQHASTINCLDTILLALLRLPRTQPLDNVFQFKDTLLERLDNADTIRAGFPGNNPCLPDIDEASGDTAKHH